MMKYLKFLAAFFLFASGTLALAADLNGYTAQYECRAGNSNCNVDVVGLTSAPCDVTVTTSDGNWKQITGDSTKTVYCIDKGDHTAKGTLTLPYSGSVGAYKVLRYTRSGDSNDEPWGNQATNDTQVKLLGINTNGGNYWLIHRLTFPSIDQNLGQRVFISGGSSNIIINRILIEGMQSGYTNGVYGVSVESSSSDSVTLQNSVIRNSFGKVGWEPMGFSADGGTNIRVVNNELYDWSAHAVQIGQNNSPTISFVVENNDIYETSAIYTQSNTHSRTKNPLSIKSSGTSSANYNKVIHNRIWGSRQSDGGVCCIDIDGPTAITFSTNGDAGHTDHHTLVQNNILFDSQIGIAAYNGINNNVSIIGNVIANLDLFSSSGYSAALDFGTLNSSEAYLNTIINSTQFSFYLESGSQDVRCNSFISASGRGGGAPPSGVQADYNAFYDSTSFTFNGTNTKVDTAVTMRANSKSYSMGTIIKTGPPGNCTNSSDPVCFLYKVVTAGTTAGTAPPYCTSLGCTVTDGAVSLQAIRGPYTFYRKLRTSPEPYTIPYARVHASAPEASACPSDYAARSGVGVNDVN